MPRVPVRVLGVRIPGLAYDFSISDPAFAAMLNTGAFGLGPYSIYAALQSPAFYRGVDLICGTIATLPLKTYRNLDTDNDDDARESASSFLDLKPAGAYPMTAFDWKYQVAFHLTTEGGVGLKHLYTEMGVLNGFLPCSPSAYEIDYHLGFRRFRLRMADGTTEDHTDEDFTQILGLSLDGVHAVSPVFLFQRGIQLNQAQEIAAMRTMTNGMHIAGLVSPANEDISEDDAKTIKRGLDAKVSGPDNAGALAMVNKRLVFTPWTQSNTDAQFIEGRRFSREDVALMLGLPIYMLNPEKQTSWGTGVAEQNLGLSRYTLMPKTSRIEEAVSRRLSPSSKFVEFDYKGLLQSTPDIEVKLILEQYTAGLASFEECRDLLGFGPKDPGDTFLVPTPVSALGRPPVEPGLQKPVLKDTASSNGGAQ